MEQKEQGKRKLSKAELQRKENFERVKKEREADGYRMKDLTFSSLYANVMALIVSLPLILLTWFGFFWRNPDSLKDLSIKADSSLGKLLMMIIFIAAFLALVVVHELVHGITWAIFTPNHFKAIAFGLIVKYLTPYCTCRDALKKSQYIMGALMPTLLLGIIPGVIAIITGGGWWLVVGIIMTYTGGGDITLVLKLLRYKTDAKDVLVYDHPYEIGSVLFIRS